MSTYDVTVHIFIKPAVLNPEEKPVAARLRDLGFKSVSGIRMGKCQVITLDAPDGHSARLFACDMCDRLLINHVTETFEVISVAVKE